MEVEAVVARVEEVSTVQQVQGPQRATERHNQVVYGEEALPPAAELDVCKQQQREYKGNIKGI